MTTNQKLSAIREMVRDLGEVTRWDENGKRCEIRTVMLLGLILKDSDVYTEVDIDAYGQLNIGGYDGICEGWAMEAKEADERTIDRVYQELTDYAICQKYPYTGLSINERINLKAHFQGSKWHHDVCDCPLMSQVGLEQAIMFGNTWQWYWSY